MRRRCCGGRRLRARYSMAGTPAGIAQPGSARAACAAEYWCRRFLTTSFAHQRNVVDAVLATVVKGDAYSCRSRTRAAAAYHRPK